MKQLRYVGGPYDGYWVWLSDAIRDVQMRRLGLRQGIYERAAGDVLKWRTYWGLPPKGYRLKAVRRLGRDLPRRDYR